MTRNLTGFGLLVLVLSAAGSVADQTYPARPIRLIVANAPGSSNDVVNRIVAAKLSDAFGQQVVVDNRAGESQWTFAPLGGLIGHIKVGRLRALAISSKTRSPLLPELPTVDEAGVPDYEFITWTGFWVPKGTPRPIINSLHAAIQKVLAEPDTKQLYAAQGMVPHGNRNPEELDRFLRADFDRMARLIKISGIKPE